MTLRLALAGAAVALLAACTQGEAATGPTSALTEPQVRAFVDKVEAATYSGNDRAVTEPALADDVKVTWRTPGEDTIVWAKDEFLEEAVDTEPADGVVVDYDYEIGAVDVAADGKSATAKVAVTESFEYDGSTYVEASDQVYRIELRDGEPKIVALEADSKSLKIDGEEQF